MSQLEAEARSAFEKWARSEGWPEIWITTKRSYSDEYTYDIAQTSWKAWVAASHTAQESRGDRERFLKLWQFAFACAGAGIEVDDIDASDLCRDVARSMDPDSIVAQMEALNLEAESLPSVVPPVPQTVNVEEER